MLTTLFLAAAVTALPPLPTDYVPPKQPVLSPKHMELKASLGTPMLKTVLIVPKALSTTTNFLVSIQANGNQIIVSWTNGQSPYQVLSSPTLLGPWNNTGPPTMLTSKTCPMGDMGFIRVQGNVPLLSITHTNPTTLTWVAPEIDMSDSLTAFKVLDAPSVPANDTPSSETGWTLKTTIQPGQPLTYDDTSPLPRSYKIIETTANGVVVPYNVQSASGGGCPIFGYFAKGFGGTGSVLGRAVAVEMSTGNIIVVGTFNGTVDFGNSLPLTSAGGGDMFLVRYSGSGICLWAKSFGNTGTENPKAVALDASGNIFVAGTIEAFTRTSSTATGGSSTALIDTAKNFVNLGVKVNDAIVYTDGAGAVQGLKITSIGTTTNPNDTLHFATSSALSAGLSYRVDTTMDVGTGILISKGGSDVFLAKYSSDGTPILANRYGGPSGDNLTGMVIDLNGNPILSGITQSTCILDFDNNVLSGGINFGGGYICSGGGAPATFVAKISGSTLTEIWHRKLKTTGNAYANGVAVDASGNPFVVGHIQGTIDFDDGLGPQGSSTGLDPYVTKLSASNGSTLWGKLFGGANTEGVSGLAVAVDSGGNPIFTGVFLTASLDFGGGHVLSNPLGIRSVYLTKLSGSAGACVWAVQSTGSSGAAGGASVALTVDKNDNSVLIGTFDRSITFGTTTLNCASIGDGFTVKYSANGAFQWVAQLIGTTASSAAGPVFITTDCAASIVQVGSFLGTVNLGGTILNQHSSYDLFVQRLNP